MKILIRLDDEALAPAAGPAARRDVASAAGQALATARATKAQSARAEAGIDRVLVQRFNGGDEAAFVEIVTRYRGMITALALRFLRNHADAEEIAQDTFIRAHRGLARFRGEASLATWLHRIAVNLSRNRYWHFFRRRRHMTISLDMPLGPESSATFTELVAGGDAGPARQATVDEFVAVVAVCMEKLDDPSREILTLRTLMHNSYEEIARALGINQGTVKSRIARARGKLRELMVETCPEFPVGAAPAAWFEAAHAARLAS
ncbi:MAG: sigma-70 family RNA polymerase sigma factor [Opitutaceae bacterium]|nr:sigma-70 family RNA polymerase sigma factor [Opitutaceae bacterium]